MISMSVLTELTRRHLACRESQTRLCFLRPQGASALRHRVRSYLRIRWLVWKRENGAVSHAWWASTTARVAWGYVNRGRTLSSKACNRFMLKKTSPAGLFLTRFFFANQLPMLRVRLPARVLI